MKTKTILIDTVEFAKALADERAEAERELLSVVRIGCGDQ